MNDVMLFSRLQSLGMSKQKAWDLTAKIRDKYHPIAAVAAAKLNAPAGGLGLTTAVGTTNQATKSGSLIMTGASVGATVGSVFPVVGTAIGAAVGAVVGAIGSLFGPAKEGQAATTWDDMVKQGYLFKNSGRSFDERYFAEAMKGAMDKGNNAWSGCGKDGYKNPDCFYGPMAKVIVQGYLTKKVPLSASTADVYNDVVTPWLKSGAAGLFTYAPFAAENASNGNIQGLLVQGVVDRYLSGLPITRADMVEYDGQGYTDHEPALNVALASLLTTTTAPSASPSVALAKSPSATVTAPIAAAGTKLAQSVAASGAVPTTAATAANISAVAPAPPAGYTVVKSAGSAGYWVVQDASGAQWLWHSTPGATTPIMQYGTGYTPAEVAANSAAALTATQATAAALLQSQLAASEGVNLTSAPAQQLAADVAANGVQQTDLGPPSEFDLSSIPWYVWAGGAGLALYLAMRK
jgi:hypothetical protein